MVRIWAVCMILRLCLLVGAQPLACKEDAHCSEGYYCATQAHVCRQCMQCEDFNRFAPSVDVPDSCIRSVEFCGDCFEGFVNIYETHMKGQCVSPEFLQFESRPICVYVWMTAAITGSLVVVIFVYVIKNTLVFQIVPNYDPVSITGQDNSHVPVSTVYHG